jgi:glutaredoxin
MNKALLLLLLITCGSASHAQRIYSWVDENDVTHFGDAPLSRDAKKVEVQVHHPVVVPTPRPEAPASSAVTAQPEIIMYGAAWCGVCKRARSYFIEKNIHYTEYDIDTSAKGRRDYQRLNGTGVPIFLVDGQRYNGFTAARFDTLLGR